VTSRCSQSDSINCQYSGVLIQGAESGRVMNALQYCRSGARYEAKLVNFCQKSAFGVLLRMFGIPTMHEPESSRMPRNRSDKTGCASCDTFRWPAQCLNSPSP
jgi:hypothetical protein